MNVRPLRNPIVAHAAARPHGLALSGEASVAWAELLDSARIRAGGFASQGVTAGDVVGLAGGVDRDWLVDFHALQWLGATVAPFDGSRTPQMTVQELRALTVDWCVCGDGRTDTDGAVRSLSRVDGPPADERPWPLDETRVVLRSSGTSGAASVVPLSTAQVAFSAFASAIRLGHLPTDRWLSPLPVHHVGGLSAVLRCFFYGTCLEPIRFDPRQVARKLAIGSITHCSVTPRMLAEVVEAIVQLNLGRKFPNSVRAFLVGGAACPDATREAAVTLGLPIALTWGMTEAASQVCTAMPGAFESAFLPPLPFISVVEGANHELIVDGPFVSRRTVTADVGTVGANGHVRVVGRRDDAIVSGGLKIDPGKVEVALRAINGVEDAAVVARPSPRWGQRPVAYVELSGDLEHGQWRDWLGQQLPRPWIPDHVTRVDKLPRNALGKLRRDLLRQDAKSAHGIEELFGHRARFELRKADERVPKDHDAAQIIERSGPADTVLVRDAAIADRDDSSPDQQPIMQTNGAAVARLSVDQRHTEPEVAEVGRLKARDEQLIEAVVGELESLGEEHDSGAIDVMKARGDRDFETHVGRLQPVSRNGFGGNG